MTNTWAAKVLEGVPRLHPWHNEDAYIKEADALAAIARMGAGDDMVERLLENDREIFLPLLGEAAAHIAALTAERDEALESVTNNNEWFGMHSTLWMWLITQPDMPQLDDLEDGGADEVARNYERAITALVDARIAALTAQVADHEKAAQENDPSNLWRFWANKAKEIADSNAALRERVAKLVEAAEGLSAILDKHETKGPLPDVAMMLCWLAAQNIRAVLRGNILEKPE